MSGQLKEVRDRMKSVRSTQQITRAMKMVSAAKLRRAQDRILQLRPFSYKFDSILAHLVESLENDLESPYAVKREVKNVLLIVATSDRGLCGAFNSNVIKEAIKLIEGKYAETREDGGLSIMCIGKRGLDFFKKQYKDCNITDEYVGIFQDLRYVHVQKAVDGVLESFRNGELDAVDVAYGRFKNPATQFPDSIQLLPVKLNKKPSRKSRADYLFEPGKPALISELVPSILRVDVFRCILETNASEHGARMTAMDKATENAEELMKELQLNYNKARQEAITKELSEIVGGAAAQQG